MPVLKNTYLQACMPVWNKKKSLQSESKIVIDFVVKQYDKIYLETHELDQNWADHAVAFLCWDMIMNQWLKVFYL